MDIRNASEAVEDRDARAEDEATRVARDTEGDLWTRQQTAPEPAALESDVGGAGSSADQGKPSRRAGGAGEDALAPEPSQDAGHARADPGRQREFEELRERFEEEGRYPGREEEVAARVVNKQRGEFGETQEARAKEEHGQSPDRGLPIRDYQHLPVTEVVRKARGLSADELRQVREFEAGHRARKTLLAQLDRLLARGDGNKKGAGRRRPPSSGKEEE